MAVDFLIHWSESVMELLSLWWFILHLVVLATPRFFSLKIGNFSLFKPNDILFFLEKNKLKALYVFHSSVRKCSCIKNWHYLELQDLIYPVPELWYPGIDSGLVFFSTTNTPTNDTRKHESSVLSLNNHWSATVTLKLLIVILKSKFSIFNSVVIVLLPHKNLCLLPYTLHIWKCTVCVQCILRLCTFLHMHYCW